MKLTLCDAKGAVYGHLHVDEAPRVISHNKRLFVSIRQEAYQRVYEETPPALVTDGKLIADGECSYGTCRMPQRSAKPGLLTYCDDQCTAARCSPTHDRREAVATIDADAS